MIEILENRHLQLSLNLKNGAWSLVSVEPGSARLENVSMGMKHTIDDRKSHSLIIRQLAVVDRSEHLASPHGPLRQIKLRSTLGEHGLNLMLEMAMPESHPFLLWRFVLENHGTRPVAIDGFEFLNAGLQGGEIVFPNGLSVRQGGANGAQDLAFFSNGWQSWSYTGVYGPSDRMKRTRLGPFRSPTEIPLSSAKFNRPGNFASQMFGVLGERSSRAAILAGFLSQLQHFGSLECHIASARPGLRLWADGDRVVLGVGEQTSTDWACLQFLHLDQVDPLGSYIAAVVRQHGLDGQEARRVEIPTGWCSWYQYCDENYIGTLTEQDLRGNLAAMRRLQFDMPVSVFQIDDGFEAQVGDWFACAPGFPDGMAPLAAEIRAAGLTPGLWLAPFILHPKSRLAGSHPEWLLRGRFNRPVNAGFLWNRFTTALDPTHPEALAYAAEVVHTAVHDWGYPYIKLDFLYAAALPGKYHDPTRTRAQVLRMGLEALRAAAGERAYLLGCACPLGPAIGLVDGMRVGADTAKRWKASFAGIEAFFDREPNLPAARNALHNAITRAPLHRRLWINDPDCLLLREETQLSLPEVQSAASVIALTGGALMLSDDLARLSAERLQIANALLPVIGMRAQVRDWFDASTPGRLRLDLENLTGSWHLLAVFNWADQKREMILRLQDFGLGAENHYIAREFWTGNAVLIREGSLPAGTIPAHGVRLFAVRSARASGPLYLGSSLHISQGLEVSKWEISLQDLSLKLERPGYAEGILTLSLPQLPKSALLDGKPASWRADLEGFYHIGVKFNQTATMNLRW